MHADDGPDELLVTVDGQVGTTFAVGETLRRAARRSPCARSCAFPARRFFSVLTRKLGWGGLADRDETPTHADRAAHQELRDHRVAHAAAGAGIQRAVGRDRARASRSSSARSACCSASARARDLIRTGADRAVVEGVFDIAGHATAAARARRARHRRRERHRRAAPRDRRDRTRARVGQRHDRDRRRARRDRAAAREPARPARGADAARRRRAASHPRRVRRRDGAGERRFAARTTRSRASGARSQTLDGAPRRRRAARRLSAPRRAGDRGRAARRRARTSASRKKRVVSSTPRSFARSRSGMAGALDGDEDAVLQRLGGSAALARAASSASIRRSRGCRSCSTRRSTPSRSCRASSSTYEEGVELDPERLAEVRAAARPALPPDEEVRPGASATCSRPAQRARAELDLVDSAGVRHSPARRARARRGARALSERAGALTALRAAAAERLARAVDRGAARTSACPTAASPSALRAARARSAQRAPRTSSSASRSTSGTMRGRSRASRQAASCRASCSRSRRFSRGSTTCRRSCSTKSTRASAAASGCRSARRCAASPRTIRCSRSRTCRRSRRARTITFVVAKGAREGVTTADTRVLDGDERVVEIARMLGGDPESDVSQAHARELLATAAVPEPGSHAAAIEESVRRSPTGRRGGTRGRSGAPNSRV